MDNRLLEDINEYVTLLVEAYKHAIKSFLVISIAFILALSVMFVVTVCNMSENYTEMANNAVDAYLREDVGWAEQTIEQNVNMKE